MAVRHKNTNNGTKINGGNTVKRTVTKPIIKDEPIENQMSLVKRYDVYNKKRK